MEVRDRGPGESREGPPGAFKREASRPFEGPRRGGRESCRSWTVSGREIFHPIPPVVPHGCDRLALPPHSQVPEYHNQQLLPTRRIAGLPQKLVRSFLETYNWLNPREQLLRKRHKPEQIVSIFSTSSPTSMRASALTRASADAAEVIDSMPAAKEVILFGPGGLLSRRQSPGGDRAPPVGAAGHSGRALSRAIPGPAGRAARADRRSRALRGVSRGARRSWPIG